MTLRNDWNSSLYFFLFILCTFIFIFQFLGGRWGLWERGMQMQVTCYKLEGENNCSFMLKWWNGWIPSALHQLLLVMGSSPRMGAGICSGGKKLNKRAGICILYIHMLTKKGEQKEKAIYCKTHIQFSQINDLPRRLEVPTVLFQNWKHLPCSHMAYVQSPSFTKTLLRKFQGAICSIRM